MDDIGTVHSVKVRAESLNEATLLGLNALSRVGWESDGNTIGNVLVEVHYEPTSHEVDIPKFLRWLKQRGRDNNHEREKQMLRDLMK